MNANITRAKASEIIKAQKGKIFTAYFVSKVDGTSRRVNGRLGVTKFLKGEGNKNNSAGYDDIMTAFSMEKMQYRNISLDNISKICAGGKVYEF